MPDPLSHIMYVDDEPDMRMLFQAVLESEGNITVTLCERGDDAVDLALEHRPQMIILDVMMDGKDGPAVLRDMRREKDLSDTPVIFLTAKTEPEDIKALKDLGAAGILAKPFDMDTITGQVRALWEDSHGGKTGRGKTAGI